MQRCYSRAISSEFKWGRKKHEKNSKRNNNNEVRLDFNARGYWVNGQTAFFDERVLDATARR